MVVVLLRTRAVVGGTAAPSEAHLWFGAQRSPAITSDHQFSVLGPISPRAKISISLHPSGITPSLFHAAIYHYHALDPLPFYWPILALRLLRIVIAKTNDGKITHDMSLESGVGSDVELS